MIPLNLISLSTNGGVVDLDPPSLGRRLTLKRVRFADDMQQDKDRTKTRTKSRRRKDIEAYKKRKRSLNEDESQQQNNKNDENSKWVGGDDVRSCCCLSLVIGENKRLIATTTMTPISHSEDDDDDDFSSSSSSSANQTTTQQTTERFPNIPIPDDPRVWSRLDVYNWLEHMKSREVDLGDLDPGRFLMNGKALCLMSPAMFVYRVPRGGKILYKDFQTRLCRAVAIVHHNNLI